MDDMINNVINFNHDANKIYDSMGLPKWRVDELVDELKENLTALKEASKALDSITVSTSRILEYCTQIAQNRAELVFLTYTVGFQDAQKRIKQAREFSK